MAQVLEFNTQSTAYSFEINGRAYEVCRDSPNDKWRWESGFRTQGGFDCYAEAAQDAMRDAREAETMTPEQAIFRALTDAYWRTDDIRAMAKAAAESISATTPDYFAIVSIIRRYLEEYDFVAMANKVAAELCPARTN